MTDKKVAIIMGGGSGMGADSARRLAADGFHVAILSSSGKGEALAAELGGLGLTGTNKSSADMQKLVDAVMKKWGRIDVLVNSAGHGPRAPVLEISDEDWHEGMEVYFLNSVRATRIVAPIMIEQKSGTIINISTFAAFEPDPIFPTSGVMRAGLAAYTKLFGQICRGQCAHEQRAAGLYRQPAGERRLESPRSDGALRQLLRRDRGHRGFPRLGRRRLYHRPEYPRRRRHHPLGLRRHSKDT